MKQRDAERNKINRQLEHERRQSCNSAAEKQRKKWRERKQNQRAKTKKQNKMKTYTLQTCKPPAQAIQKKENVSCNTKIPKYLSEYDLRLASGQSGTMLDKNSQSVKVGAFVLVEISSKQSKQTIVAKVMEIDGDEVQLFLMASDTNCIYRLPEREYVSWESISNIRKVLPQPRLSKSSTKDRLC
ncbi:hypothetical protein MAR_038153 [Mya arenaria]|uniref:Uncharacterized protein n=1 Tax=Mya arenaria TaxID=6604 RepID=A0ABY7FUE5_MYAAR|nr:hypothetical protein MAR_038153 [Mya arenaria]